MKRSIRWITLFVLLLSLAGLACGLGGDEESAPTSQPAATAASAEATSGEMPAATEPAAAVEAPAVATQAPEAGGLAEVLTTEDLVNASDLLEQHNSYHAVITMNFDGASGDGTAVNTVMNVDLINVQNPPASRFTLNMTGIADEATDAQVVEITTIGDTVYTSMTGLGCFSGSAADMGGFMDSFDTMISPEKDLVNELENVHYAGTETHNGFVSECYTFDQGDVPGGYEDADSLEGKLCLSKELGFISHISLNAMGVSDQFTGGDASATGSLVLEYNVTELDAVAELTIPADCLVDTASSQWPVTEDAANVSTFQGIVIFSTNTPFDEVLSFYETEMAALGYELSGEPAVLGENSAILDFTGDAGNVSVTVTAVDDSGSLQVLISPSE